MTREEENKMCLLQRHMTQEKMREIHVLQPARDMRRREQNVYFTASRDTKDEGNKSYTASRDKKK